MSITNLENAWIAAMKEAGGKKYDLKESLLEAPYQAGIHTDSDSPLKVCHPIRESLYYALILLRGGEAAEISRAHQIIERVIGLQETGDPAHARYGLWHYYAEGSVMQWEFPDMNWADFNGMSLLLIWHMHWAALTESLREKLKGAIGRAALCVRRRNVDLEYTNIAIKGTLVVLGAAELLDDPSLLEYAQDRIHRLHATVFASGSFAEYNSPTYAAVSLGALMAFDYLIKDGRARELALAIQHRFWIHIAAHFHVPTCELAGPHSRAYTLSMRDSCGPLGPLLEKATGGAIRYGTESSMKRETFSPLMACLLEPNLPEEARKLLGAPDRLEEIREVTRKFQEGSTDTLTTYIHPGFCMGSVNFQDGWEQRHNLIAYWPSGLKSGYFRHEYLHDQRPCCSGWFTADQKKGTVLAASFIGDFADHHVSFPTDHVEASFLGTVLELNNHEENFAVYREEEEVRSGTTVELYEGDMVYLRLPRIWMALKVLRHRIGWSSQSVIRMVRDASTLRIELPHYQGEVRKIKWVDFGFAHTCYALVVVEAGADWGRWKKDIAIKGEQRQVDGTVDMVWGDRKVSLPPVLHGQEGVRAFFAKRAAAGV